MTETIGNRDTVAIDEAVHEIYKQLTEGNDAVQVPFRTMKDVFMWAMMLGYRRRRRQHLTGKKVTVFRWAQFSPQTDIPLLKAVAIADSGGIDVLLNQPSILATAEEYANAGIYELRSALLQDPGQPLWHLTELLT